MTLLLVCLFKITSSRRDGAVHKLRQMDSIEKSIQLGNFYVLHLYLDSLSAPSFTQSNRAARFSTTAITASI